MVSRKTFLSWPVVRQLTGTDPLGAGRRGRVGPVGQTHRRAPTTADRVARTVCPYCAVGCGQRVFVKDEQVIQIEGDPDSPISRGRLCPKGSASKSLVTSPLPADQGPLPPAVRHRVGGPRPRHRDGHDRRPGRSRPASETWQDVDDEGRRLRRTLGIASLGGATLDNEENYLIKKLFTAHGRDPDREPGPHLTLRHRPRSGDQLRSRRRHRLPAGPRQR